MQAKDKKAKIIEKNNFRDQRDDREENDPERERERRRRSRGGVRLLLRLREIDLFRREGGERL